MTVYFARAGKDGPIKIGFTAGVAAERIPALQTGCPWPIIVLFEMPGGPEVEAHLHGRLDAYRMCGEWFEPTADVLAVVEAARSGTLSDLPPPRESGKTDEHPAVRAAIRFAGSEAKLSGLIGFTQPAINKAKRGRPSPEMSVAIARACAPAVTKSMLRPDLWPVEQAEAA